MSKEEKLKAWTLQLRDPEISENTFHWKHATQEFDKTVGFQMSNVLQQRGQEKLEKHADKQHVLSGWRRDDLKLHLKMKNFFELWLLTWLLS